MARTKNETIRDITIEYLQNIDVDNPPAPADIEGDLIDEIEKAFELENAMRDKTMKWKIPSSLNPSQIADIMKTLYPICCIACAGNNADASYDLLAIYQADGPDCGIYVTNEQIFNNIARRYNYNITTKELKEVMSILRDQSPRKYRCDNPDLIAVNNGIFDYSTKILMPFDPDYIFIAKSRVNYNPAAKNITIHNAEDNTDWDIESWMNDLSDDPEIVNVLWEILGAIIRPHVRWNKSAWLYSNTGNNGKGTLCELMRNLCGDGSYASIPLTDFSKDFMLEPLTRASAIIVDENDVGGFIDKAANLKAIITNDVIQLNRKFKTPIAYQFFGFMVQCLNEYPRIKDKSDSFYRRQLFIPFEKCFTGKERKYIKNDYLHRPEVLEYVLHKVLHMTYYTLSEPAACVEALNSYKEFNDPIRQFADEVISICQWDLLPFSFLYDCYKSWFKRNSPSGSPQGKNTFITDIINLLPTLPDWTCQGRTKAIKPAKRMDKSEALIIEYDLKDWMNPDYTGADINQKCRPKLKNTYNGLLRVPVAAVKDASDDNTIEIDTPFEDAND